MANTRLVVCIGLFIYCWGLFVLAIWPTDEITWSEWVAAVLAVLAGFGLIAHATDRITIPGERYAYLVVGFAGFTTMLLYLMDTTDEASYKEFRITMLLLAGVVGGYGFYLTENDDG